VRLHGVDIRIPRSCWLRSRRGALKEPFHARLACLRLPCGIAKRHTLTLARDRLGEKPLYYGRIGSLFCFASELKAIRAVRGHELELNRRAVSELMQFAYVPSPISIYKGLSKLAPGHFVQIGKDLSIGEPKAYWALGYSVESGLIGRLAGRTDDQLIDLLHDQLRNAVGLQMVSDVPLGHFCRVVLTPVPWWPSCRRKAGDR